VTPRTWRILRPKHAGLDLTVTAHWLVPAEDGRLMFVDNQGTIIHMLAPGAWTEVSLFEPFSRFIPVNAEQAQNILAEMNQVFEKQGETDADRGDASEESSDGKA